MLCLFLRLQKMTGSVRDRRRDLVLGLGARHSQLSTPSYITSSHSTICQPHPGHRVVVLRTDPAKMLMSAPSRFLNPLINELAHIVPSGYSRRVRRVWAGKKGPPEYTGTQVWQKQQVNLFWGSLFFRP